MSQAKPPGLSDPKKSNSEIKIENDKNDLMQKGASPESSISSSINLDEAMGEETSFGNKRRAASRRPSIEISNADGTPIFTEEAMGDLYKSLKEMAYNSPGSKIKVYADSGEEINLSQRHDVKIPEGARIVYGTEERNGEWKEECSISKNECRFTHPFIRDHIQKFLNPNNEPDLPKVLEITSGSNLQAIKEFVAALPAPQKVVLSDSVAKMLEKEKASNPQVSDFFKTHVIDRSEVVKPDPKNRGGGVAARRFQ